MSDNAEPSSLDVLALVEQITGADVDEVGKSDPRMTQVSLQQVEDLRTKGGRAGGGCAIEAIIDEALRADVTVQTALAQVPRDELSVSYAAKLWDGAWRPLLTTSGFDAATTVQQAVDKAVGRAPDRCRHQRILGPRFFIVPTTETTVTVLVIGAEDWRWRDLAPTRSGGLFGWFGSR